MQALQSPGVLDRAAKQGKFAESQAAVGHIQVHQVLRLQNHRHDLLRYLRREQPSQRQHLQSEGAEGLVAGDLAQEMQELVLWELVPGDVQRPQFLLLHDDSGERGQAGDVQAHVDQLEVL